MKRLLLLLLIITACMTESYGQKKRKLTKDEQAKMTPDQRIVYENDRQRSKHKKKKKKDDSIKAKAKRAKKQDRSSRRIKQPK